MKTAKAELNFEIIVGSYRKNGNTEQVANYMVDKLAQYNTAASTIFLREYKINKCGGCGECNTRDFACAQNDDMPKIVERITQADAIIYVAPVHGYGLAHPMQIFIERAGVGYLRFQRPLANKPAGCVVVGRRYGHLEVFNQLVNNILLNRMILVGSGYPTVLLGGTPGKALQDSEGVGSVDSLLSRMVGMAQLFASISRSQIDRYLSPATTNERETYVISR